MPVIQELNGQPLSDIAKSLISRDMVLSYCILIIHEYNVYVSFVSIRVMCYYVCSDIY